MWIEHSGVYFDLSKFTQILRGDDEEILLCALDHNMEWTQKEEEKICILKFPSKKEREKYIYWIESILNVNRIL